MFQITFKILNWIRPYKARMILGFSMSFLNAIFIALPIFLAAKIFNNVLSHKPIYMKDILNVVIIMVLLVIGRFITAYFKSKSHESIAYEMSAKENTSLKSFNQAVNESKRINTKIEMQYIPFNLLHLLSLKVVSIMIVLVACLLYMNHSIDLPTLIMISIFSFVIFDSVENINSAAHVLEMIDMTIDDIEKIKNAPELDENGKNLTIKNENIAFQNVNFSYDDKQVIKNVNFEVPTQTSTAIIGPSGSGKSTLCHLLLRFYDIDDGNIRIDGVDIKDMTLSTLMSKISAVFQKVYLFNDTIENNILFGNPGATKEEIIRVAKQACCHDFIMSLPEGYQTMLNEKGSNLSGGEKQRISIARAILKDAPIIILDEATASIDPENEQLIQTAINELSKGKTVITIAHKLETIKNADQIIVLNDGEIIQRGSHNELIQKPGMYQDFIRIKSKSAGWKL
ncbi:TPA: ATP-binding cassette domain-containing protein [Staphylococcus aureus]|nr:ATP-binding cassette domain-containing protein [Staphylococcus aureus]HDD7603598.1 ATP-binding cassette domain-containing protein [Staphylococcus aureus]